jgi:hypothetical protein
MDPPLSFHRGAHWAWCGYSASVGRLLAPITHRSRFIYSDKDIRIYKDIRMALVSLYCLVYGEEPAFSRVFEVTTSPEETISKLRGKIWEETKRMYSNFDARDFVLYIPTPAISTADEDSFENEISRLKLDEQEGKAVVKKLNPTSKVSKYTALATPGEELLHIIVVVPSGG